MRSEAVPIAIAYERPKKHPVLYHLAQIVFWVMFVFLLILYLGTDIAPGDRLYGGLSFKHVLESKVNALPPLSSPRWALDSFGNGIEFVMIIVVHAMVAAGEGFAVAAGFYFGCWLVWFRGQSEEASEPPHKAAERLSHPPEAPPLSRQSPMAVVAELHARNNGDHAGNGNGQVRHLDENLQPVIAEAPSVVEPELPLHPAEEAVPRIEPPKAS